MYFQYPLKQSKGNGLLQQVKVRAVLIVQILNSKTVLVPLQNKQKATLRLIVHPHSN